MKTLLIAIIALGLPLASFAGTFQIPVKDRAILEDKIALKIGNAIEFPALKNFSVDWKKARCLEVKSVFDETPMGVCVVPAGAFQVSADMAVVKKSDGYEISLIDAAVE
jgi:hypothetical protein